MNWIKKLIPAYIEIRSLYWVQYYKQMNLELEHIFNLIDNDHYHDAQEAINGFNYKHSQGTVPMWVALEMAKIHKAQAMINFLASQDIDTIFSHK